MFENKILILILPLILVIAINGVPIENLETNSSSKAEDTVPQKSNETDTGDTLNEPKENATSIVAVKVPEEKDGTQRPMLFIFRADKTTTTTTTTVAPTTTTTTTPASTTTALPSTAESIGTKENDTRVMLIKVPSVDNGSTPRPMLIIYSMDNTTTTTAAPTSTDATQTSTTTAPTKTTAGSTTPDTALTSTTVAPNNPGTMTIAVKVPQVENNGTPHPMLWINSPSTPSADKTVKRPENFLRGYDCPKRNGFFPYLDKCDVYIMCKDYIPLTYICPDGLQFNSHAKQHEHVCDDPSVVKCKTEETPAEESEVQNNVRRPILFVNSVNTCSTRPDSTTGVPSNVLRGYTCPKRYGFFSYPGKCDVYIICEDYTPLSYICPEGLQFNPDARNSEFVCDAPSVMKCGNRGIKTSKVPTEVSRPTSVKARQPWSNMHGFSCPTPNGYFRFTDQCDEYVECRVYTPLRFICPDGLHFKADALWTEYPCVEPSLAKCSRNSW